MATLPTAKWNSRDIGRSPLEVYRPGRHGHSRGRALPRGGPSTRERVSPARAGQMSAASERLAAAVSRVATLIFTLVEVLLVGRVLLKLGGANASQPLVASFYSATDPLVQPFQGIFPQPSAASSLDLAALLAAVFVVLVTALLVGVVRALLGGRAG